jgi:hypothetical protein
MSVQLAGNECCGHLRPETRPSPRPNFDDMRSAQTAAETMDGTDALLGRFASQCPYEAHLTTAANAIRESSFATLECELLDRCRFKTQIEARMAAFEFIEGWSTPIAATPPSTICHRSTTKGFSKQKVQPTKRTASAGIPTKPQNGRFVGAIDHSVNLTSAYSRMRTQPECAA